MVNGGTKMQKILSNIAIPWSMGGTKMHKILSNISIPWSIRVLRCTKYSVTLQFHGQWGY